MGADHGHHTHGAVSPASLGTERTLTIVLIACAVVTVIGLAVLWPGSERQGVDPALLEVDTVGTRVTAVVSQDCSYDPTSDCVLVTFRVTGGERKDSVFVLEQPAGGAGRQLAVGDDVKMVADELADGTMSYSFYDYERSTPMLLLLALFAGAIVLLGRWRGVGALAGLVISLVVLVQFTLPALLDGSNAVAVALVSSSVIAFIALYLAHGYNPATTVALLSTFAALVVTGVLSWMFVHAAKFTGYTDDSTRFLDALQVPIDPRGILLAGIVIGSLGVLDDVTVTQVSAVWELRAGQPELPTNELYRSALRIGRDHISSTVNTLFLAYAGASLPLLLLFSEAGRGIADIATRELVAVEVVRALVGSIGLVSAVPISTWLAARVLPPVLVDTTGAS